jgi:hypothetical protein
VPAREEVTTISVSRQVVERLRLIRAKLGARSWDELFTHLADTLVEQRVSEYDDMLESLSALYFRAKEQAARGDPSKLEEFVVWVERKLSPLLSRYYEEARALLAREKI